MPRDGTCLGRHRLAPDASGRSVARIDEQKAETCTPESKKRCEKTVGPEFCYCAVGDGRLEIWAPILDGPASGREDVSRRA